MKKFVYEDSVKYLIYLDTILLPVTPERVSVKVGDKNNTIELADGREHMFIKKSALREISFQCLLPNQEYRFAQYHFGTYEPAKVFVEKLLKLKDDQKAFQFIFNRVFSDKSKNHSENIKVVIRDLEFTEEHGNGNDIMVSINLKEVDDSKTKVDGKNGVKTREISNAPTPKANTTYTVKKGDSLWAISKKFYGDGNKFNKIADANKAKIKDPNKIQIGMVLTIPK